MYNFILYDFELKCLYNLLNLYTNFKSYFGSTKTEVISYLNCNDDNINDNVPLSW